MNNAQDWVYQKCSNKLVSIYLNICLWLLLTDESVSLVSGAWLRRAADCRSANEAANILPRLVVLSCELQPETSLLLIWVVPEEREVFIGVRVKREPHCSLFANWRMMWEKGKAQASKSCKPTLAFQHLPHFILIQEGTEACVQQ